MFVNAKQSSKGLLVIYFIPNRFKIPKKVYKLDKVLYRLRDSPVLWYNDFLAILKKLGLVGYTEEPCLFINK